ncbi:hypothetical protein [Microbispora bryophytorum]|uniref:hypothetical protein n=1 Tax=Microbispora bryophytorum TaxID=1460882 RepID=UPI0033D4810B
MVENLHYMVKASRLRRLAVRRAASGPGMRLSGRSRPAPPARSVQSVGLVTFAELAGST